MRDASRCVPFAVRPWRGPIRMKFRPSWLILISAITLGYWTHRRWDKPVVATPSASVPAPLRPDSGKLDQNAAKSGPKIEGRLSGSSEAEIATAGTRPRVMAKAADGVAKEAGSVRTGVGAKPAKVRPPILPLADAQTRATAGDAEAQFQMGRRNNDGWGVRKDWAEAARWFQRAADQGHSEAMVELGYLYEGGQGVTQSRSRALELWRRAAEVDNPEAQYCLGFRESVKPGKRDQGLVLDWYQKAAAGGNASAQEKLARAYEKGDGVAQDESRANFWRREAERNIQIKLQSDLNEANDGNPVAMVRFGIGILGYPKSKTEEKQEGLSWMLRYAETANEPTVLVGVGSWLVKGDVEGIPSNPARGAELIQEGMAKLTARALEGDKDAAVSLGWIFYRGDLGSQDIQQSEKWFRLAADLGHGGAAKRLFWMSSNGEISETSKIVKDKWELTAAESGEEFDQFNYGWKFYSGRDRAKDDREAEKWFRRAADRGSAQAQKALGLMYKYGEGGLSRSPRQALEWLLKAVESGEAYETTINDLTVVYAAATSIPGYEKEALRWYREVESQKDASSGEACYGIGNLLKGDKDGGYRAAAVQWYKKAADMGVSKAAWELGLMYANGDCVAPSPIEAERYLEMGASGHNYTNKILLAERYEKGEGVSMNWWKAKALHQELIDAGIAAHKSHLGVLYFSPLSPFRDVKRAFELWLELAIGTTNDGAGQSVRAQAQFNVGLCYAQGQGVAKDELESLAWMNLAAASGLESAIKSRGELEAALGRQLTLLAQQRSKAISASIAAESEKRGRTDERPPVAASRKEATPSATGSGVIVSKSGYILTAAHVVIGASRIMVVTSRGECSATTVRVDEANDLAVLKLTDGQYPCLPISPSRVVRLGQSVATIGFPNVGIQGFSPKVTKGEISSLNGIGDDPRAWQISAPVQTGNSGGPLLDEHGNIVGVVVSKLGIKAVKATGDIPQNVNYAVKSAYALALLEPFLGADLPQPNTAKSKFEDMVATAQQAVVLILVY
jgi:TPR repeat protein